MNDYLVSIVVPVFNNGKYIDKCLRSIISQSYRNIQIIIVNDGSTDKSSDIIKKYADEDKRIVVVEQSNSGVSSARNVGLEHVIGDYITFIDGDDYVSNDYIKDLLMCAKSSDAEMVVEGITMVNPDGTVQATIVPKRYERFEHEEWTFRLSAVAAHLYKFDLWQKYDVKFYEGERGEDMPVSLFFSGMCENISVLSKADYFYVQHSSSAMHSFRKQDKSYLPYNALESTIVKMNKIGIKNSKDFHELFALRIMSTMINIAKGANREEVRKLSAYIGRIIGEYYEDCGKNPYVKLTSDLDIPFSQKIAVKLLIIAKKTGTLTPLLRFACR